MSKWSLNKTVWDNGSERPDICPKFKEHGHGQIKRGTGGQDSPPPPGK